MGYDGSGNFSRAQNFTDDRNNGIKIRADRMDAEFNNFAVGMNAVLLRSGVASMTGTLNMGMNAIIGLPDGTAFVPAIRFSSDATTGVYSSGFGKIALAAGATQRLEANSTGVIVTGTLSSSGASTLASLGVTGNATVGGTLGVTGVATFTTNATVGGTLGVTGVATLSNNATVGGTLGVTGVTTLSNNATVGGTLGVTGAVTLTTALAVGSGGVGITSYAVGDILYASGAATLSKLADVATGNALISGGVGVAPSWGKIGISTHVSGLGTGVATALGVNTGSAGAFVLLNGALGTPTSGTLTSCTGLPISTGVSGLASNMATFLATPSSANLAATMTDETGTGANVFAGAPTFTGTAAFASLTSTGSAVFAGGMRSTSVDTTGWAGHAAEVFATGGQGYVNSYNRTAATFGILNIQGSSVLINPGGSTVANVSATGVAVTGTLSASGAFTALTACVGGGSLLGTFMVHVNTDQNLSVQQPVLLANGVTISSLNDANSAGKGLELRGSDIKLTASGTAILDCTAAGLLNYGGIEVGYKNLVTAGALTAGKLFVTSAGFTVNTGAAADTTQMVYNDSAVAITLTQGGGLTMRLAGTTTTGSRTLAPRGFATLWSKSTTEVVVNGNVT